MSPPGHTATTQSGITGTRNLKAETNRAMVARIKTAGRRAGIELEPWQVRSLLSSLRINDVELSDDDLLHELMRAPWWPRPRVRTWRVGEGGGWATRS